MVRTLFVVLALLAPRIAVSDTITNITVNGTVSGTGFFRIRCQGPEPGCVLIQETGFFVQGYTFNFSGINTQLGTTRISGGATGLGFSSVEADGLQRTTATSDDLNIYLNSEWTVSSVQRLVTFAEVDIVNDISVGFDLTTESLMKQNSSDHGQLFDADGNLVFCCEGSVILHPGAYKLNLSVPLHQFAGLPGLGFFYNVDESVNAHFTPIPEPRCAPLLIAMLALGCFFHAKSSLVKRV